MKPPTLVRCSWLRLAAISISFGATLIETPAPIGRVDRFRKAFMPPFSTGSIPRTPYDAVLLQRERRLDQWMANWSNLTDFEVYPVMGSKEAAERITRKL